MNDTKMLNLGETLYYVTYSYDPIIEDIRYYVHEWKIVGIVLNPDFTTTVKLRSQNKYVNHDIIHRDEIWAANNAFFRSCFTSIERAKNYINYRKEHPISYCFGYQSPKTK